MPRHHEWYALSQVRCFPLDESATGQTDSGDTLPTTLLADLYLSFPSSFGRYAMLSGITVTPRLLSLVLVGVNRPASFTDTDPGPAEVQHAVAALSLARPVDAGVPYQLKPLQPGVHGWVVFGRGITGTDFSGRFSTVAQSQLTPRTVRVYHPPGIENAGQLFASDQLTGLVRLRGGNDVEIVGRSGGELIYYEIDGQLRQVGVIRLKNTTGANSTRNVLDLYRGPCSDRPESFTCDGLDPVQRINGVEPDCCGRILVEFVGCVSVIPGGSSDALLDCPISIEDVCQRNARLPDESGNLPDAEEPTCGEDA